MISAGLHFRKDLELVVTSMMKSCDQLSNQESRSTPGTGILPFGPDGVSMFQCCSLFWASADVLMISAHLQSITSLHQLSFEVPGLRLNTGP